MSNNATLVLSTQSVAVNSFLCMCIGWVEYEKNVLNAQVSWRKPNCGQVGHQVIGRGVDMLILWLLIAPRPKANGDGDNITNTVD